eukprot:CAMPEP_0170311388 /NCGR_PEP_ID=MMETSP0116_2-20130129/56200_1 /TAXON_ID=400756 /ORGANISM="Durinskia baltica, Strain CSIRO CS-38" /LENGTH=57 /DNA_ID=CAMNT_0010563703 /DNA_START=27 /DNA_END=197 /DNA_ORIENTATION=-
MNLRRASRPIALSRYDRPSSPEAVELRNPPSNIPARRVLRSRPVAGASAGAAAAASI